MQVWFEVPEHLRDSWADVVHGGRYVGKLMKNKIVCDINNISNIFVVSVGTRSGRTSCGPIGLRTGTHVLVPPAEFQYREYEWRWLLTSEFNNPRKQVFK